MPRPSLRKGLVLLEPLRVLFIALTETKRCEAPLIERRQYLRERLLTEEDDRHCR